MFLPATLTEAQQLGWDRLDVILVTGDAYIDSPFTGVAVIGKVLADNGFRTGIIAQPDTDSPDDITRLGEPALFWGITGGCIDSMVANYTALKKKRKKDDYTPGGFNTKRPDRAVIAYSNLVRRYFKKTRPIVLGGIEASLRRIAHYDFWDDKIRRSILFDSKADYILYGMAHKSIVRFARAIKENLNPENLRGLAFISRQRKGMELPCFEVVRKNKKQYIKSFHIFYENNDPVTAKQICQRHNDRYLVQNPPEFYSTQAELDHMHSLDFERELHPFHKGQGKVKALETIRFSIPVHYGCYGECNFCAIAVHQGRTVRSRSRASIVAEAVKVSQLEDFKGYITDLGGPTANMYGFECRKKIKHGPCPDRRCLFPSACRSLVPDHSEQIKLIQEIEALPGIKKVFISSGIRYDLVLKDRRYGKKYMEKIVKDNVSGQLKIAPEHTEARILKLMGKQDFDLTLKFKHRFDMLCRKSGKNQFLTYYLIAAHPGSRIRDMKALKKICTEKLKTSPEQVQIFTPTPSTYSTLMYYTGLDPFTLEPVFVEKNNREKEKQKKIAVSKFHRKKRAL